jgi:hypothetical protein
MCKFSAGCGSSDSYPCKNCKVSLCKQCNRSLKTGNPPASGNSANVEIAIKISIEYMIFKNLLFSF